MHLLQLNCLHILLLLHIGHVAARYDSRHGLLQGHEIKYAITMDNPNVLEEFKTVVSSGNGTTSKVEVIFINQTMEAVKMVSHMCKRIDILYSDSLNSPQVLFDLTKSGSSSEAVKVVARYLKVFTVSLTGGNVREWASLTTEKDNEECQYLIRIKPPQDSLSRIIRIISAERKLTNAAVYFQKEYGLDTMEENIFPGGSIWHKLTSVDFSNATASLDSMRSNLQKDVENSFSSFFLVADGKWVCKVFDIFSAISRTTSGFAWDPRYLWHIVTLSGKHEQCSRSAENMNFIRVSPWNSPDLDEQQAWTRFVTNVMNDTLETIKETQGSDWWTPRPNITCKTFEVHQRGIKYKLPFLAQLLARSKIDDTNERYHFKALGQLNAGSTIRDYVIEEVHCNNSGGKVVGTWSSNRAGIYYSPGEKLSRGYTEYKVVTIENPPFVYRLKNCKKPTVTESRYISNHGHCYYGYSIDVLDQLAQRLNFTYKIYQAKSYGYPLEHTRSWKKTSLIGAIVNKEADFGIGAITVMPERETVVDFTRSFHPMVGFTFIMQRPKIPMSLFQFMAVLEGDVWWCILGAYVFTALLLYIFDRFGPSSYPSNRELYLDQDVREFTWRECFWFCFSSMTPQGGGEAPKGLSGRLIASTWWLFSFIILASYTANLAAFLTVARLTRSISSFEDLISQHTVQYYPVSDSSAYHYIDRMATVEEIFYEKWKYMAVDDTISDYERTRFGVWTYPIKDTFTKIWQAVTENDPPPTIHEAIDRVRFGNRSNPYQKFALIGEQWDLQHAEMLYCEVMIVGKPFSLRNYAIPVQKGSPLKQKFDEMLNQMEEDRHLEKFWRKWWHQNPYDKKCQKSYSLDDGVAFGNMGGAYIILSGGLFCTIAVMFLEVLAHRFHWLLVWLKWKALEILRKPTWFLRIRRSTTEAQK